MDLINKKITFSTQVDFLLVYCPLWFPIVYLFAIYNFSSYAQLFFLAAIFLFAETHFASTWLFFFDKDNHKWIKRHFFKLVFIPFYCLIFFIFAWFVNPNFILIFHYLASGFHVTRQSVGVAKISGNNSNLVSFTIYFFSTISLLVGLLKPGLLGIYFNIDNYFLFYLTIFYLFLTLLTKKINSPFIRVIVTSFTGVLIYLPLFIFDNLAIATVVGVGMHWCQYIVIMFSVNIKKRMQIKKTNLFLFIKKRLFFIFSYSLVMTSLTFLGMPKNQLNENSYSLLYLIPLIFQLFHFYLDGFIWKFSDKHIRKSVGSYLIT